MSTSPINTQFPAMQQQSGSRARYDLAMILLHWAMATAILVLFLLGWYMVDLPKGSDERTFYFGLHKSIGLTGAALLVLRISRRLRAPGPAPAEDLTEWQRRLSMLTHWLLYVFMALQPLSGYISSSFAGYPTRFWGWPLPQWADKDPALNELFTGVHESCSVVLALLIGLHVCGGLAHLWGGHVNVLRRMLPWRD